jgi:hypothetical protein
MKGDMGIRGIGRCTEINAATIECIIELKTVDVPAFKADYRRITLQ